MNGIFRYPLFLLLALLVSACATTPRPEPPPDWVSNPGDGVVGSAITHVRGRYYQEELAIARARERLAARYGVEVSSVHAIKERVRNDQAFVSSDKEIYQRVGKTLVKAQVRATWYDKAKDEMWVWMYPIRD
jgi:hypothetical protein